MNRWRWFPLITSTNYFMILFFTEPMALVACPNYAPGIMDSHQPSQSFSLRDLLGDGILWAVPKHRKSIERRLKEKYGNPKYVMKIYRPKTTLRVCIQCGHDHEVGVLCRKCGSQNKNLLLCDVKMSNYRRWFYYFRLANCYKRVMDETKQMQEKITNQLGLDPVEKEVVVLYDGERDKVCTHLLLIAL